MEEGEGEEGNGSTLRVGKLDSVIQDRVSQQRPRRLNEQRCVFVGSHGLRGEK